MTSDFLNSSEKQEPWALPRSWKWVLLGELCTFVNGRAFKTSEWSTSGLPIIRIQNLTDPLKSFNHYSGPYKEQHRVQEGDVLVSWSGTPGSSFGAFLWTRPTGVLNQHIFRVLYDTRRVVPAYLVHSINRRLEALIRISRGGVGLKHFTKGQLERLTIPIPFFQDPSKSIIAQRAIVAKLERLKHSIQAGSKLTSRMLSATNELLASAFEEVMSNLKPKTPSVRLEKLAHVRNGNAKGTVPSGMRVFKTRHVYPHLLRLDNPTYAPITHLTKDKLLQDHDILMANIAEGTLGRVTYVSQPESGWTVDTQITIISPNLHEIHPKWLYFFLWSRYGQRQILARRTGIAFAEKRGQTHIYPGDLKNILVVLPELEVQERAASYLDLVLTQCEQMAQHLRTENLALQELDLRVMDMAFKGEL